MSNAKKLETWSSQPAFLLATIGAAVGLGNLWRFPFIAGQNGGGAFVLVYFAFVLLLCLPIVMAELSLGKRGKASPVDSIVNISKQENANPLWQSIGWLSLLIPMIGLSYYSIVAGWSIDYLLKALANSFAGFDGVQSQNTFDQLLASPWRLLVMHTAFIAVTVFVVAKGVQGGIEKLSKVMMPCLFLLLIVLVLNSIFNSDIQAGIEFLFYPDWSKITAHVIFMALGQAFFSVAIGVGVLMTYGSYMPAASSIRQSATVIVLADTMVAVLAGLAIFPVVFQFGLDPSGGPGLIFITLPSAFGQMGSTAGHIISVMFFALLFFAAFSTAIGMLEPVVSWFGNRGMSRPKMAVVAGFVVWAVGLVALLSFNVWQDVRLIPWLDLLKDKSLFDLFDFTVSNVLLPINALLIAVFAGWVVSKESMQQQLGEGDSLFYSYWRFSVCIIAPIAITAIVITSL